MGLLDKIFGKINNNNLTSNENQDLNQFPKTSEMLNEDKFWDIIESSLKKTTNQDEQEQFLIKEIGKLTLNEIIGFRLKTDKLLYDTYSSEMWCAAYVINGGCSDDGFEYFRCWLISRGKEVYYKAKENPDSLIEFLSEEEEDIFDFESFWYVALNAFENKTGKSLYDYIDYDNFIFGEGNYLQFDFSWEEEDPESMRKICPNLFERFFENQ